MEGESGSSYCHGQRVDTAVRKSLSAVHYCLCLSLQLHAQLYRALCCTRVSQERSIGFSTLCIDLLVSAALIAWRWSDNLDTMYWQEGGQYLSPPLESLVSVTNDMIDAQRLMRKVFASEVLKS